MKFYGYVKHTILEWLKSRNTLKKVIENIKAASANGKIAFYPCGKCTRTIISEIETQAPEILPRIIGCFDKSHEAGTKKRIHIYNIESLDEFKGRISSLVVASNTFYAKELTDIKKLTSYDGPIIKTSHFNISIQEDIDNDEIISQVEEVYNLLTDQKSKMTYLITWLSRVLNDEDLTYLFESEKEMDSEYNNYVFQGMTDLYIRENPSDFYRMRYVSPRRGDIVFDIGAYKGDTAIYFADRVGKEGKVYSFEPVKSNYNFLVKNIALNEMEDIIVPVNKGCSNKSGFLKAISVKSGAPWSFLSEGEEGEEVEVISIDEFIETNNISKLDFMKMDVEGWEDKVILGVQNTIKRFNPKVVIPLYHNASDLFTIPLLMNNIGNYHLYIRCKMEGPFGISLYCIQK